jgi:superfamily II DNA or RNA helicase
MGAQFVNFLGAQVNGEVRWSLSLGSWVRVIGTKTLFGKNTAKVLVEGSDHVVTVPVGSLSHSRPQDLGTALSTVAGARIWSSLGSDLFLSPLVSKVLPLPHQFRVIRRALQGFPVRMMLADEVGLGKTIEAGLVIKELKLRGMIERVLVLAPKSLLLQWVSEMDTLFGERFELVLPGDWSTGAALRGDNAWKRFPQVITSFDGVKPKDTHKGWDRDRIERYNLERYHDLIGSGWDLVVIDESHKLAGSSSEVARYALADGIARATPHVLLLTATPHSGKTDAFRRLLALLDPVSFQEGSPINRETVAPYVIRTDKRTTVDADGNALFAARTTRLLKVPFEARHSLQQELYDAVSTYVIEGYKKAERAGDKGSRLLLILIQRLMSSSTRAVRGFLEKRLLALQEGEARDSSAVVDADSFPEEVEQGALFYEPASGEEQQEIEGLLALCRKAESRGPDARAEALLDQMRKLCQRDGEPDKKFLVFTEFTGTQGMLQEFLEARGYDVVTLNGSMDIPERKAAQEEFRSSAQVLINTDAGAEGLNMQFAHVVINYDLPWAPMRVEQRIGRVDRIGQTREVVAINLALENSVEARVYEVWQEKLARILEEFGVDKTGDVLDSVDAEQQFERLARTALLDPQAFDNEFDQVVNDLRRAAREGRDAKGLYEQALEPADRVPTIPLRAWLDTLTQTQHRSLANEVDSDDLSQFVVNQINHLNPYYAEGQPVPVLRIDGLGFQVEGSFSIWKVGIADGQWRQQHVYPLFVSPDGQSFTKTAERLWDSLAAGTVQVTSTEETEPAALASVTELAEVAATSYYEGVLAKTQERARRRLRSLEISYLQRRSALASIGLDNVRETRRRELEAEFGRRSAEIESASGALPDLQCLFMADVTAR